MESRDLYKPSRPNGWCQGGKDATQGEGTWTLCDWTLEFGIFLVLTIFQKWSIMIWEGSCPGLPIPIQRNVIEKWAADFFLPLYCALAQNYLIHVPFNLWHRKAQSKNLSETIPGDFTLKMALHKCVTSLERLCSNLSFCLNEVIPQGTLGLWPMLGRTQNQSTSWDCESPIQYLCLWIFSFCVICSYFSTAAKTSLAFEMWRCVPLEQWISKLRFVMSEACLQLPPGNHLNESLLTLLSLLFTESRKMHTNRRRWRLQQLCTQRYLRVLGNLVMKLRPGRLSEKDNPLSGLFVRVLVWEKGTEEHRLKWLCQGHHAVFSSTDSSSVSGPESPLEALHLWRSSAFWCGVSSRNMCVHVCVHVSFQPQQDLRFALILSASCSAALAPGIWLQWRHATNPTPPHTSSWQ